MGSGKDNWVRPLRELDPGHDYYIKKNPQRRIAVGLFFRAEWTGLNQGILPFALRASRVLDVQTGYPADLSNSAFHRFVAGWNIIHDCFQNTSPCASHVLRYVFCRTQAVIETSRASNSVYVAILIKSPIA